MNCSPLGDGPPIVRIAWHSSPPVEERTVLRAREILLAYPRLSARDALHVATMDAHGIRRILTFDRGFDDYPGIERISA